MAVLKKANFLVKVLLKANSRVAVQCHSEAQCSQDLVEWVKARAAWAVLVDKVVKAERVGKAVRAERVGLSQLAVLREILGVHRCTMRKPENSKAWISTNTSSRQMKIACSNLNCRV
jgi:D-serine deaminase-like pyridoxal phosphate-dependent protein